MALRRFNTGRLTDDDLFPRRFTDLLDDFFSDAVSRKQNTFVPRLDISETDNRFEINVELPGMKKDQIDVSLDNNQLTVSGKREWKEEDKGKTYHRIETSYGEFKRSFRLPDNIDEESINAKYNNGVLNITINTSEAKVSKKISIK
jgi:HSP20 family protein